MLKGLMQHRPIKLYRADGSYTTKKFMSKVQIAENINFTDSGIPQIALKNSDIGVKTLTSSSLNMLIQNGKQYKITVDIYTYYDSENGNHKIKTVNYYSTASNNYIDINNDQLFIELKYVNTNQIVLYISKLNYLYIVIKKIESYTPTNTKEHTLKHDITPITYKALPNSFSLPSTTTTDRFSRPYYLEANNRLFKMDVEGLHFSDDGKVFTKMPFNYVTYPADEADPDPRPYDNYIHIYYTQGVYLLHAYKTRYSSGNPTYISLTNSYESYPMYYSEDCINWYGITCSYGPSDYLLKLRICNDRIFFLSSAGIHEFDPKTKKLTLVFDDTADQQSTAVATYIKDLFYFKGLYFMVSAYRTSAASGTTHYQNIWYTKTLPNNVKGEKITSNYWTKACSLYHGSSSTEHFIKIDSENSFIFSLNGYYNYQKFVIDNDTCTNTVSPSRSYCLATAYSHGIYIRTFYDRNDVTQAGIQYSNDGLTWTENINGIAASKILWIGGTFVIASISNMSYNNHETKNVYYSLDGITWTPAFTYISNTNSYYLTVDKHLYLNNNTILAIDVQIPTDGSTAVWETMYTYNGIDWIKADKIIDPADNTTQIQVLFSSKYNMREFIELPSYYVYSQTYTVTGQYYELTLLKKDTNEIIPGYLLGG